MFQFKIHEYLWRLIRVREEHGDFLLCFVPTPSPRPAACTFRSRFFWDKRRKLLLMMKTKGCEEKWGFVKSLCTNLIKRTTWHFLPFLLLFFPFFSFLLNETRGKGESWIAVERFEQSIFYYFLLYEKRDFYSNSSSSFAFFSSFSVSFSPFLGGSMQTIGLTIWSMIFLFFSETFIVKSELLLHCFNIYLSRKL